MKIKIIKIFLVCFFILLILSINNISFYVNAKDKIETIYVDQLKNRLRKIKPESTQFIKVEGIKYYEVYEIILNDYFNKSKLNESASITLFIKNENGEILYQGPYELGQWYSDTPGGIKFIAKNEGSIYLEINASGVNDGGSYRIEVKKISDKIKIKNFNKNKTKNGWQRDLYYFTKWLLALHPDPFENTKKEIFEEKVNKLFNKIPNLEDSQIVIGFLEIAALLKDGHTYIADTRYFNRLPLSIIWLQDGLYINGATNEYYPLMGSRVEKIGKYKVNEVFKMIKPLISSENEYWSLFLSQKLLLIPDILYYFNIIDSKDYVELELYSKNKGLYKVKVKTFIGNDLISKGFVYSDEINEHKQFLFNKNKDKNYWFEYLPQNNTIYFKYNRCFEMKELPFRKFVSKMFDMINKTKPDKIIIDLRNNLGGYSFIIQPFIEKIKNSYLNENGKIFVITNKSTFSAGVIAAYQLKKETEAILIGEPAGNNLKFYGGAKWEHLPNKKLLLGYATMKIKLSENELKALNPDYVIKFNSKQYFNLNDPVINFIFSVF